MSNNANLYNKNFNIIETNNSFKDIYTVYKENDNENVVNELKGSIIISLTNDKNEIILCSDNLYNLSPRFSEPIYSTINKDNTTTVRLNYNNKHFNVYNSKLELTDYIINEIEKIEKIEKLENDVKELKENIEELKTIINDLTNQDSNSNQTNPEDQLENENNN